MTDNSQLPAAIFSALISGTKDLAIVVNGEGLFNGEHYMVMTSIIILCTAVDHPTGFIVERVQEDSGSFRVLWTPPAFSASLIGYRIYYSGANDSGSVDVDALATNVTIGDCIPGVTYNITMVALSPHLPSAVIGPATVTPGESFVYNSIDLSS